MDDNRTQIELDASALTFEYAASGEVCNSLYHGILNLLDRQAAITEYDLVSDCGRCSNYYLNRISELVEECEHVIEQVKELVDDA